MTCAFDCRCQACRIEHFTRPTPELDAWLRDPATTADPRDMTIAYLRAEVARLTEERDRLLSLWSVQSVDDKGGE